MTNRYFLTGSAKTSLAACSPADAVAIQTRIDNLVELASTPEGREALRGITRQHGSRFVTSIGGFEMEFSVSAGNPVLFVHHIRLERPRPEAP